MRIIKYARTQPLITRTLKPLFRQSNCLRKEKRAASVQLKWFRDRIPEAGNDDRCQAQEARKASLTWRLVLGCRSIPRKSWSKLGRRPEAEAQKLLDDDESKPKPKPKKKRSESLPAHLPEVKQLCDVPEQERVCPKHGPMAMIDTDKTETLV